MSRHFECGASKRKRKEKQDVESKKHHGSMNKYLFNSGKISHTSISKG